MIFELLTVLLGVWVIVIHIILHDERKKIATYGRWLAHIELLLKNQGLWEYSEKSLEERKGAIGHVEKRDV
ncbi:MAG: hypothetical protein A3E36_00045 [Candidatus Andersenbacteria bacterium RIFCSPHIGHO2_12_FULL_45_11b]|uniref:Uncharacterized protein n=1 Tax=Candidatus Andersenbacteria bacterium RIFCSPHIGHO2_12_FULL_45_11b TaxID=1797282 RepID=A0A1G1X6T8_9BACT|nr:MAG: hypothetical protein A3E36_00045 [Candidatus Andersenbacteria bacterium RIFCSPHIGHO2_12_FULL_45_11b]